MRMGVKGFQDSDLEWLQRQKFDSDSEWTGSDITDNCKHAVDIADAEGVSERRTITQRSRTNFCGVVSQ